MSNFDLVNEFHEATGGDEDGDFKIPYPHILGPRTRDLRISLIEEEVHELIDALNGHDVHSVAHELADVLYVVYGTAASMGIDIDEVFKEVHRANMSKVGGVSREDGKVLKPEGFVPADVRGVIDILYGVTLPEIELDTPVVVTSSSGVKSQRHFAGWNKDNGWMYVWKGGRTSWTDEDGDLETYRVWNFANRERMNDI